MTARLQTLTLDQPSMNLTVDRDCTLLVNVFCCNDRLCIDKITT